VMTEERGVELHWHPRDVPGGRSARVTFDHVHPLCRLFSFLALKFRAKIGSTIVPNIEKKTL